LSKKAKDSIGYECILSRCAYSKYQNDEDSSSDSEHEEVKRRKREKGDRKQVEGKAIEPLETVLNSVVAVVSLSFIQSNSILIYGRY
jgi:hypothetical protein